jgi:DNA-binding NtrC family response regulator
MYIAGVLCLGSDEIFSKARVAAREAGCQIDRVTAPAEMLERLQCLRYSVALVEHDVADLDVAELAQAVRKLPFPAVIVFQGGALTPLSCAARLVRAGVYYCLDPGCTVAEMAGVIMEAAEEARQRDASLRRNQEAWRNLLVGESPNMQDLARIVNLVARRRSTVLITGETGTGKELVARAIHAASDRSQSRMVALNCSAIPENLLEAELFGHTKGAFTGATGPRTGRFEEANESTLFLDEIGDMPVDLQAKLLRVLQEREIQRLGSSETIKLNVRVIAASNLNLLERVKQGRFREDLYYRLNVVPIAMPPLRERPGDIPLLVRHFIDKVCKLEGIERKEVYQDAMRKMMRYSWPGNVRQLENVVEKAVVMSDEREALMPGDFSVPVEAEDRPMLAANFPPRFSVPDHGLDFAQTVTTFEKSLLDEALRKTNGNKTLAADLLRLKRTTLVSKLRVLETPDIHGVS